MTGIDDQNRICNTFSIMTATCKKSDVLEMRISSSGYTLISLLSKDCLKSKAPDLLRLKYNAWCSVCSDSEPLDQSRQ